MSRFYLSKVSLNEQEEGRRSSSTNNNPPREGEMRSFTVWSEKWTSVHYCLVGHPIFHISKVKPVQESALVPAALAPMPPWFMMEVLPIWFAAWFILITVEEGYSIWLTGWGTVQRKGPGSQLDILRTRILSGISTATLTSPRRVALQGTLSSLPSEVSDYGEGQEQPPSDQTVLAVILLMLREERLGWNFLMRILIFSIKIFYWFRVDFCPDNNVIHSCSYFPPFIFSSSLLASLYNYVKWSLCLESSRLMSICLFSWIWRDLEWRVPVHQVVQKILCLFVDINYWWISCECYRFASSGGFIWMWMRHYKVVEMTAKLQ